MLETLFERVIKLVLFALFNWLAIKGLIAGRVKHLHYYAIAIMGIASLALLFSPSNILSASPSLALFVRFASFFFPAKQWASKANFQEAATLYYAITAFAYPFGFLYVSNDIRNSAVRRYGYDWRTRTYLRSPDEKYLLYADRSINTSRRRAIFIGLSFFALLLWFALDGKNFETRWGRSVLFGRFYAYLE